MICAHCSTTPPPRVEAAEFAHLDRVHHPANRPCNLGPKVAP